MMPDSFWVSAKTTMLFGLGVDNSSDRCKPKRKITQFISLGELKLALVIPPQHLLGVMGAMSQSSSTQINHVLQQSQGPPGTAPLVRRYMHAGRDGGRPCPCCRNCTMLVAWSLTTSRLPGMKCSTSLIQAWPLTASIPTLDSLMRPEEFTAPPS